MLLEHNYNTWGENTIIKSFEIQFTTIKCNIDNYHMIMSFKDK